MTEVLDAVQCGRLHAGVPGHDLRTKLLNELTRLQCKLLGRELDLTALSAVSRDWCGTDLLFQVTGPLHSLPLSFVPFGNRPLYRQVASTSHVISLDLLKQHRDAVHPESESHAPGRDILATIWEEHEPRQTSIGLPALLRGVQQAAAEFSDGAADPWRVWSLGDQPLANIMNVRAALQEPGKQYGLAVFGCHGAEDQAGLSLADRDPWQGDNADLSQVDLTILNVCSIGRLNEEDGGARDVTGLYVQLVLSRCRSAVTARWPIADTESAALSTQLVREYLQHLERHRAMPLYGRARAFNAARRQVLETGLASEHLVAAFEYYGLP